MVGPGYTVDANQKTVTGDLVAGGKPTGVKIEVRAGGPAIGFTQASAQMYTDKDITLGYVSTDEAVQLSDKFPTTAVFAENDKSPMMIMWDPAKYPDVTDIKSLGTALKDSGGVIRYFNGAAYMSYLIGSGILDKSVTDGSYDGTPANFVAAAGKDAQQGFATAEPYIYQNEVPAWGKPVKLETIHDTGFPLYPEAMSVRSGDLEKLTPCLKKLVPVMQQADVDYITDPATTNALILDLVKQYNNGWVYSQGVADFAVKQMKDLEIASNGDNAYVGDMDEARVQKIIDIDDADLHRGRRPAEVRPGRHGPVHQRVPGPVDRLLIPSVACHAGAPGPGRAAARPSVPIARRHHPCRPPPALEALPADLRGILGDDGVSTDPRVRERASVDGAKMSPVILELLPLGLADVVAFPTSADQIAPVRRRRGRARRARHPARQGHRQLRPGHPDARRPGARPDPRPRGRRDRRRLGHRRGRRDDGRDRGGRPRDRPGAVDVPVDRAVDDRRLPLRRLRRHRHHRRTAPTTRGSSSRSTSCTRVPDAALVHVEGDEAQAYVHNYGTAGILARATVRLEPLQDWRGFYASFDDQHTAFRVLREIGRLDPAAPARLRGPGRHRRRPARRRRAARRAARACARSSTRRPSTPRPPWSSMPAAPSRTCATDRRRPSSSPCSPTTTPSSGCRSPTPARTCTSRWAARRWSTGSTRSRPRSPAACCTSRPGTRVPIGMLAGVYEGPDRLAEVIAALGRARCRRPQPAPVERRLRGGAHDRPRRGHRPVGPPEPRQAQPRLRGPPQGRDPMSTSRSGCRAMSRLLAELSGPATARVLRPTRSSSCPPVPWSTTARTCP